MEELRGCDDEGNNKRNQPNLMGVQSSVDRWSRTAVHVVSKLGTHTRRTCCPLLPTHTVVMGTLLRYCL